MEVWCLFSFESILKVWVKDDVGWVKNSKCRGKE